MCIHLKFDYKKATQALNFLALKNHGRINKLKAIKLVYLADRYHLRKYGRPITNDEYFAMSYGAVNSGVKDICEMSSFLGPRESTYASQYLRVADRYHTESIKYYENNVFSESDVEALSFAWDKFGHYNEFELAEIAHKYPEWKRHEETLKDKSRVRMNYEDFLDDPAENIEKCYALSLQDKEDRLAELQEIARLDSLWS